MSISHFRTNKELNSNRSNFAQMSMFFKYSYFLLGKNIGSEARLTLFKSQFSHLPGLGIKFGPMKEYVNSYLIANNRQSTRFIFSCQTEKRFWSLSLLYNNDNKKKIVKDSGSHDLPLALKLRNRNLWVISARIQ